jgi:hypothetical protein
VAPLQALKRGGSGDQTLLVPALLKASCSTRFTQSLWFSLRGTVEEEANVTIPTTMGHLMMTGALALGLQVEPSPAFQAAPQSGRASHSSEPKAALDHLSAAKGSLEGVARESLTPEAATKVADVKQRVAALEQSYLSHGTRTISKQDTPSGSTRVRIAHKGTWSSQIADIDSLLGRLIDSPTPIARLPEQDEVVKSNLREARTHLTAFAVAATGTSGPPARRPE